MSFQKAFRLGLGFLLCLSLGAFLVMSSRASASTGLCKSQKRL